MITDHSTGSTPETIRRDYQDGGNQVYLHVTLGRQSVNHPQQHRVSWPKNFATSPLQAQSFHELVFHRTHQSPFTLIFMITPRRCSIHVQSGRPILSAGCGRTPAPGQNFLHTYYDISQHIVGFRNLILGFILMLFHHAKDRTSVTLSTPR